MSIDLHKRIWEAWFAIEDGEPDISTEQLMQRVADQCNCDHGDVAEALFIVGKEQGVVTESEA